MAGIGKGVMDNSESPAVRLRTVGMREAVLEEGFWGDWFGTCRDEMIPDMLATLKSDNSNAYNNFLVAAGLKEGRHRGAGWQDGDFYKWFEAAAWVYGVTGDVRLDEQMDEIVGLIAKVQRGDGYIHTPVIIKERNTGQAQPFADRFDFEMYNMGHLMLAACVHYRATGKTTLLDVARRASDYLYGIFSDPDIELARNCVCPTHYMGIIEMWRTTREPRYLELGRIFIKMREMVEGGGDDNQDRIPFSEQTKAVGHGVRGTYLYAGAADIYSESEDPLPENLAKIWESIVETKMYITGGCGALYDGASPDGAKDQKAITRVHQSFGREYQLPNITAHNETCANIGLAMFSWRMLDLTAEARYADVAELVFYNSALAGIGLDGKSFFYTNTLRQVGELPFELRWSRVREHHISCYCCPPNIVRTVAQVGNYVYRVSPEGVWVNLFAQSRLDTTLPGGQSVKLRQQTRYPWDGCVKFVIESGGEFSLMLRIPGWAAGAKVSVCGESVDAEPGRYCAIGRNWRSGDEVVLEMPMEPMLVEANPFVEEVRNQVAVKRGPLVYCLESMDLPEGVKVEDVVLPANIRLTARFEGDLLGGICVLEGEALARRSDQWEGRLYRRITKAAFDRVRVRLVPYYAWCNRGKGAMSVWLPVNWPTE